MLEEYELLQLTSEKDMYALHYVFIPRVNMQLDVFRTSYSHHRMRTANNLSPFQLWAKGLIERASDGKVLDGLLEDDLVGLHTYSVMCMFMSCMHVHAHVIQNPFGYIQSYFMILNLYSFRICMESIGKDLSANMKTLNV